MKHQVIACLALVLLAGCDTVPRTGAPVEVPVPVPCIERMPERPAFPADGLTGDEDIWTQVTTLWADRLARRAYELKVETALLACTKIPPAAPAR